MSSSLQQVLQVYLWLWWLFCLCIAAKCNQKFFFIQHFSSLNPHFIGWTKFPSTRSFGEDSNRNEFHLHIGFSEQIHSVGGEAFFWCLHGLLYCTASQHKVRRIKVNSSQVRNKQGKCLQWKSFIANNIFAHTTQFSISFPSSPSLSLSRSTCLLQKYNYRHFQIQRT